MARGHYFDYCKDKSSDIRLSGLKPLKSVPYWLQGRKIVYTKHSIVFTSVLIDLIDSTESLLLLFSNMRTRNCRDECI